LLDTGADHVVFDQWLALWIGVDLAKGTPGKVLALGGTLVKVTFSEVGLQLEDENGVACSWRAQVAFAKQQIGQAVLGYAGCLQYFDITFFGRQKRLEVDWNDSYREPMRPSRRPR